MLKSIIKYLRELSIVVVGIVLTFGISNWIGNRAERKDMRRGLEMVKSELEDNLAIVKVQFEFHDRTGKFAKYLLSDKPENLSADSIVRYEDIKRNVLYMMYKTSAFEAVKASGAMRLIKDKELLKSIIDSYTFLETAKSISDKYLDTKRDELYGAMLGDLSFDENFSYDIRKPEYRRLFNFFAVYTASEGLFRVCEQQIEQTLDKLSSY